MAGRRHGAGDGPRPIRAGGCLALGSWPECPARDGADSSAGPVSYCAIGVWRDVNALRPGRIATMDEATTRQIAVEAYTPSPTCDPHVTVTHPRLAVTGWLVIARREVGHVSDRVTGPADRLRRGHKRPASWESSQLGGMTQEHPPRSRHDQTLRHPYRGSSKPKGLRFQAPSHRRDVAYPLGVRSNRTTR